MGGREAIRGFVVQTLVCLLDSLQPTKEAWTAVTIEPDSDNDKVDILWEFPGSTHAQQVKSSKNQIGRGDVVTWCKELKASGKADSYELMLAGPIAAAVLEDAPFDGVDVPPPASLDTLALIDQAITKIDRYLSAKTITPLPLPIRESLVNIVSANLLEGAVHGRRLSREEFDGLLLRWITVAFPEAIERRMSANCDVLWSCIELAGPTDIAKSAFELILPLTVINGGISTAVVEWFLLRVSTNDREMRYRPLSVLSEATGGTIAERRNTARPFGDFAIPPEGAVQQAILFDPIKRNGYATDRWPEGPHEVELFVKYAALPEPHLVKKVLIPITMDEFAVLGSLNTRYIAVSCLDNYLDVL
ncbi:hypothetical protein [Azonexus sp.]|uniref:hypothetical protein n=1 Tax=Azonexus sp. TaxID=1872668 RepID=UPI0027B99572|nr:hypothetical protein [Azonexus sp.]